MRIYEKGVSLVRPETKSGAKSAIICEMSIFDEDFRSLMLPLSLTLNHEPVDGYFLFYE